MYTILGTSLLDIGMANLNGPCSRLSVKLSLGCFLRLLVEYLVYSVNSMNCQFPATWCSFHWNIAKLVTWFISAQLKSLTISNWTLLLSVSVFKCCRGTTNITFWGLTRKLPFSDVYLSKNINKTIELELQDKWLRFEYLEKQNSDK